MTSPDLAIGKRLADMFSENWRTRSSIGELKRQYSIKSSEPSIYMSLFWLYYLAFTRATNSSPEKISVKQFQSIADHLTTNVLNKYKDIFGAKENAEDLLALYGGIAEGLFLCYNEHVNSSPSVHWYIGKEMCVILNGDDIVPDPAMIKYFVDILHNDSLRIKQYIDNL